MSYKVAVLKLMCHIAGPFAAAAGHTKARLKQQLSKANKGPSVRAPWAHCLIKLDSQCLPVSVPRSVPGQTAAPVECINIVSKTIEDCS